MKEYYDWYEKVTMLIEEAREQKRFDEFYSQIPELVVRHKTRESHLPLISNRRTGKTESVTLKAAEVEMRKKYIIELKEEEEAEELMNKYKVDELILCRDCKHSKKYDDSQACYGCVHGNCNWNLGNWFCPEGERKDS